MNKYSEHYDSQYPALLLLQKMGWQYISREELKRQRSSKSQVILEGILEDRLRAINSFEYKKAVHKFSDSNIQSAIHSLKSLPDEGLVRTNEKVYDLLTLGKSFEEVIRGDKKSFTIKYIDWENPGNNSYHVAEEFAVEGIQKTIRPDLVLFINGIPFVVIENKRRDTNGSIEEAISQHLRNQGRESGAPRLFHYVQILLAMQANDVKYATIDTKAKFWANWQEQYDVESEVRALINQPLAGIEESNEDRLPTAQDKLLYCLCRQERILEITYKFTLYDANVKKICRYQQYFAVKNTLTRVKEFNPEGQRKGGVIWHTQGSGKSLTMVMLAKNLALDKDILHPRVIIVTDRINLDNQITQTFEACQKHPIQARTGAHLAELVMDNGAEVITTIIDKFDAVLNRKDFLNESSNIFVLVDESHRSQYGITHQRMKKVLPKACYIGFTGTPLMNDERSTATKFGGFIEPNYTIEQAVRDKAVVPLLYEGRSAKLSINGGILDKEFARLSESLPHEEEADLKKKNATITRLYRGQQVIEEIAFDISEHYCNNWKGKGFKAMLAVPLRETALKYLKYFEQQLNPDLKINARVVISAPNMREDYEEVDEKPTSDVIKWWDKVSKAYPGGMEEYERETLTKYGEAGEEVELLIVVGKLLTGFDEPRCSIIYLAKHLAEHNLLQAIARVNRLMEGKDFGHVIDYVGILGRLDEALNEYQELSAFKAEDLEGTISSVKDEVEKLPVRYSRLIDSFKGVSNMRDNELLERHLGPKDRRDEFAERLRDFARNLQTALASDDMFDLFPPERIEFFIDEFKFFDSLRRSLQARYAARIDYKEYDQRISKMIDTHVGVESIIQITGPINIFDDNAFKSEVSRLTGSAASKADAIAHAMSKEIAEKMDEDPVHYTRFSDLINQSIANFMSMRISEAEYLQQQLRIREELVKGSISKESSLLQGKPEARAFYGILRQELNDHVLPGPEMDEELANTGIQVAEIISSLVIRDWQRNEDVQKKMMNDAEDFLMAKADQWDTPLSFDILDKILARFILVAKNVY